MAMDKTNQIQWLLNAATVAFKPISDTAKLDAEILLCHVLECERTYLFTWPDKVVDANQVEQFEQLCQQRQAGHPIAHIVGYRDFWSLRLKVSPSTLIPRPDTETLVEHALSVTSELEALNKTQRYKGLDLGTGTGAIALSLAQELPHWDWLAADFIEDAVLLAKANAEFNQIKNCKIIQSDWFAQIPAQSFHLIVSNPPYIDQDDPHLALGDVRFEPLSALTADDHGLSDIKNIIEQAKAFLLPGGLLMIEHGNTQAQSVQAIFRQHGYTKVTTIQDLSENDRISVGYLRLLG